MARPTADRATSVPALLADQGLRVIGPDDAEYDEARKMFYGGLDRRPAAIVRPANASQVARVIAVAREGGLELAVRSGGHRGSAPTTTPGGGVLRPSSR